jgi:8-oxo-dGTP diphosphatase
MWSLPNRRPGDRTSARRARRRAHSPGRRSAYPQAVLIRTCLCLIERRTEGGGHDILLGYKKTGFGAGKWVGLGGHIEEGEHPVAAAVREVEEESGLIVSPGSLRHVASLLFRFPARPAWDQTAEVYLTTQFRGRPAESDEVAPRWFAVGELPLALMWDDAAYWLPRVLAGQRVAAHISFAADCATVASIVPARWAADGASRSSPGTAATVACG